MATICAKGIIAEMTIRKEISLYGTIRYFNENNELHREDGPAVEYTRGTEYRGLKIWYINGKLHREDGPAIEYTDGTKEWHLNGEKYKGPFTDEEWQRVVRKVLLLK